MTDLITPDRAAEIRRAAARHAAGMLNVSLTEWAPREYAPDDARTDAEGELLREEISHIADELKVRAVIGTYQRCAACGMPRRVTAVGLIGHHPGTDEAGSFTGGACAGAGRRPDLSARPQPPTDH
ncbi:hypothetical protein ACFXHD_09865 [Streptomyces hydrogenans]|uniref:hypothetical protein n=1 Tax=Streptomyces hydrogenans TaxID=1873719 RepID=UPI0036BA7F5D